jgi:hypothetical protein
MEKYNNPYNRPSANFADERSSYKEENITWA